VLDQGPSRIDEGPVLDNMLLQTPTLVQSEADPGLVTMVYHWQSWPGGTVTGIRFLPFQAWGMWPQGPIGSAVQPPAPENQIRQGMRASLGPNDTIAVMAQYDVFEGDPSPTYHSVLSLVPFAPPYKDWPQAMLSTMLLETQGSFEARDPLFVVRGQGGYCVGWGQGPDDASPDCLHARAMPSGEAPNVLPVCATTRMAADAIAVDNGFLMAASSDEPCSSGLCVDGPATNVQLMHWAHTVETTLIHGDEPVVYVKLSARDDGAWVVIGRNRGNDATRLQVGRVDQTGQVLSDPVDLPVDFQLAHPIAAQLGNHIAFAWVSQGKVHAATLTSYGVFAHGEFASPYANDLGPKQLSPGRLLRRQAARCLGARRRAVLGAHPPGEIRFWLREVAACACSTRNRMRLAKLRGPCPPIDPLDRSDRHQPVGLQSCLHRGPGLHPRERGADVSLHRDAARQHVARWVTQTM